MAHNSQRNNSARYAIKMMKQKFDEEKFRYRGMLDLAIEAEYLSHLAHPNIIKMRGSLVCDSRVKEPGFFIVIDWLCETLQQRIDEIWPKEYKGMIGPFGIGKDKGKIRRFYLDRMMVAHDLSSVFRYLHSNGYVQDHCLRSFRNELNANIVLNYGSTATIHPLTHTNASCTCTHHISFIVE